MMTAVDTGVVVDILEPDPVHGSIFLELPRRALREGSVAARERNPALKIDA